LFLLTFHPFLPPFAAPPSPLSLGPADIRPSGFPPSFAVVALRAAKSTLPQERAAEYISYEKVLGSKQQEQVSRIKQYQLLKSYGGCKKCGSLEVDAYSLYERNKLRWKIDISWWLENYGSLSVNANCAKKWLKDKEHLSNCACLEQEAQELQQLFTSSLREMAEKLKECACLKVSEKVLCLKCLDKLGEKMPISKKYTFN
ncbi:13281_t:CDS:2, partial [Funneliformis geosporum]